MKNNKYNCVQIDDLDHHIVEDIRLRCMIEDLSNEIRVVFGKIVEFNNRQDKYTLKFKTELIERK